MISLIFDIVYPLIMTLCFTVTLLNVSVVEVSKKSIYTNIIIDYLVIVFLHKYNLDAFLLPLVSLIIFMNLYISCKKIVNSIIMVLLTDFIMATSDAIVGFVTVVIFNVDERYLTSSKLLYFVIGIGILILSYCISKVFNRLITKMRVNKNVFIEYIGDNFTIILFIGSVIICIYTNVYMEKILRIDLDRTITLINLITTFGLFLASLLLIYSSNKNIKNKLYQQYREKEYQQLREYTNMLENMSEDLRKFRHDHANILQIIGSYIEAEDLMELKRFYRSELLPESNRIIKTSGTLMVLKQLRISSLKGLLASKIIDAQAKGIVTNIEITDEIYELSISIIDICRIIGILMDNAIEGTLLCEAKKIDIKIMKVENNTSFLICNSCSKNTPSVNDIIQKGFTTKGEGRGVGLKIVRDITSVKYDNVLLNTEIKDAVFMQELVIYNKANNDNKL
jgi:Predicted signal transduction protein with a C-terminal ATPase domain